MGTSHLCIHHFPLNYKTIPQAEKQEEEASFCPDGASFNVIAWIMVPAF